MLQITPPIFEESARVILFYCQIAAATHSRCFHEQFVDQQVKGDLAPGGLLFLSNSRNSRRRSSRHSSTCCFSPTAFPAATPHRAGSIGGSIGGSAAVAEAAADAAAAAAVALVTAAILCQSAAGEAVEGEKPQELGRRAWAIVHDKRQCRGSASPRKVRDQFRLQ